MKLVYSTTNARPEEAVAKMQALRKVFDNSEAVMMRNEDESVETYDVRAVIDIGQEPEWEVER